MFIKPCQYFRFKYIFAIPPGKPSTPTIVLLQREFIPRRPFSAHCTDQLGSVICFCLWDFEVGFMQVMKGKEGCSHNHNSFINLPIHSTIICCMLTVFQVLFWSLGIQWWTKASHLVIAQTWKVLIPFPYPNRTISWSRAHNSQEYFFLRKRLSDVCFCHVVWGEEGHGGNGNLYFPHFFEVAEREQLWFFRCSVSFDSGHWSVLLLGEKLASIILFLCLLENIPITR